MFYYYFMGKRLQVQSIYLFHPRTHTEYDMNTFSNWVLVLLATAGKIGW